MNRRIIAVIDTIGVDKAITVTTCIIRERKAILRLLRSYGACVIMNPLFRFAYWCDTGKFTPPFGGR